MKGMIKVGNEETEVIVTKSYGYGSRFQHSITMNGIKYKLQYDVSHPDKTRYNQAYLFKNNQHMLDVQFKIIN